VDRERRNAVYFARGWQLDPAVDPAVDPTVPRWPRDAWSPLLVNGVGRETALDELGG